MKFKRCKYLVPFVTFSSKNMAARLIWIHGANFESGGGSFEAEHVWRNFSSFTLNLHNCYSKMIESFEVITSILIPNSSFAPSSSSKVARHSFQAPINIHLKTSKVQWHFNVFNHIISFLLSILFISSMRTEKVIFYMKCPKPRWKHPNQSANETVHSAAGL